MRLAQVLRLRSCQSWWSKRLTRFDGSPAAIAPLAIFYPSVAFILTWMWAPENPSTPAQEIALWLSPGLLVTGLALALTFMWLLAGLVCALADIRNSGLLETHQEGE